VRSYESLYIDGHWVDPSTGQTEAVVNPATEEVIATAAVGAVADADTAIAAARRAFDDGPWPSMPVKERVAVMQSLHDALVDRLDEIKEIVIAETGSTHAVADMVHLGFSMDHFRFFLERAAVRDPITTLPLERVTNAHTGRSRIGSGVKVREPVGVVTAITPFNFPFFLNVTKVAPALLMGNTMVLKPSPYTPLEAFLIAEVADEIGLPPGVLNVVTGGVDVGEQLTTDTRVDMVTFTGSDAVGSAVMSQGAPSLKRLLLELGGKSAVIVCEDANLDAAAPAGAFGFVPQAGQGCALTTRLLVHNSVKDEYVARLQSMLEMITVGDPADPAIFMGPLIREAQRSKVERYVAEGIRDGATVAFGGKRPTGLDRGFFYEPTLFTQVDNRMSIAQDEIFGPVGVVIGFDTDDEAIAIANDSKYGLAGGVFSADSGRAFDIALRMRTGQVAINGGIGKMSSNAPFGGYKRSGFGREYGDEGLDEYTEIKAIGFPVG
jgi:aldehyde dehydrogenase (NAD+)